MFRKSSSCSSGTCVEVEKKSCVSDNHCVEVECMGKVYRVRDSKKPDLVLEFTKEEWKAFVKGVKEGEFD